MENPDRSNDRGFLWRSRGEAKEPHSRNPACHETWPLSTRASEAMAAEVAFRMRFCRGTNCGRVFFICGPCYRGQAYCSIPAVGKRDGNSGSVPTGVTNKTLAYDRTTVIGNGVIASVCA